MDATISQHHALRNVLTGAASHLPAPREESLFCVGGRGYYENPTSDLIAYFLRPDGAHGLGPVFLNALFDCIASPHQLPPFEGVSVKREEPLADGKRIDLFLRSTGWVLAVENKIRHWLANDLEAYEAHARIEAGGERDTYLVVLAPHSQAALPNPWTPVTYRDYLDSVKSRLDTAKSEIAHSKWMVFAREFLLHLEAELYPPLMNSADVKFVDDHLKEIEDIKRISQRYQQFIATDVKNRLVEAGIPDPDLWWESWGFWIDAENREEWEFGLITPMHSGRPDFEVKVWRKLEGSEHLNRKSRPLSGYEFQEIDGVGNSVWSRTFGSRTEATEELCRIVRSSFDQENA